MHRELRVWIDFANPADVAFFLPVIGELQARGATVQLTARDFAGTSELAREHFPQVAIVGRWGRRSFAKAGAILARAAALTKVARGKRFSVALSLNSYAQIIAAKCLRVPVVTTMDYEGQPANHLAFRLADLVIVPEVFPERALRKFGARRVRRYSGLKEHVSLGFQVRSVDFREQLDLQDEVLAVLRPPPDFSAYHRYENPLFPRVVDYLVAQPNTVSIVLPRTQVQADWVKRRWNDRVIMPDEMLPGFDLLASADLVVSGGGTMNREAALLGTPTYSLFAGEPSAVDAYLVSQGLMTIIKDECDMMKIRPVRRDSQELPALEGIARAARDDLVSAVLGLSYERRR